MKKINITAGECLNEILENLYPEEKFIPFNEAMLEGNYSNPLFSDAFLVERAKTHGVTLDSYMDTMSCFLDFLKSIKEYDFVVLWFGDEPFCKMNQSVVLKTLDDYDFQGSILLNIVDEENGRILSREAK